MGIIQPMYGEVRQRAPPMGIMKYMSSLHLLPIGKEINPKMDY